MTSTIRSTLIGLAAAGVLLPGLAAAQATGGYLTDKGGAVVKAPRAGNVCVRTRQWTPALATAECDPDLVKKPMAMPRAEPMAPKPMMKKAAPKKKKKAKPMNVQFKIELQGMPFAKAEMTADNQKETDKFLAGMAKANKRRKRGPVTIGAVVVTGHTDRIGSLAYNQNLSERRAVVVKDYLVSKGVDQKLIFWEGKAYKQPIPVTKFCDNKMKRKQLIECLAPNRRVTVEVVGRAPRLAKPKK
jgi:OmpA-OmpF porin, OOP family